MNAWESLEQRCLACQACELRYGRKHVVVGTGNRTAKLMFVGEGPGRQEDEQGEPFVGAAGQLLDDMLTIIDLDRTQCYIANVVKCRPPMNRDPLPEEMHACRAFLEEQLSLIAPRVLVCLGRIAAQQLIDPNYRITHQHGQFVEKDGVWMTAFYHPAALLRDGRKRPDAFRDLLALREKLRELGISG